MRIQDFLQPHLDGISLVVESHRGSLSLRSDLDLPAGIDYESRARPGDARAVLDGADASVRRVLELAIVGPDPALYGPESDVLDAIRRLEPGDLCAILFGYETYALPFHLLLDELTAAHAEVVDLSALDHDHLHAAAIVTTSDRSAAARDPLGDPLAPDDDPEHGDSVFLRTMNEYAFADFVLTSLRAKLVDAGPGPDALAPPFMGQVDADLEQARAEVELARADAERAWAEVERIAGSTSFRLGRTLVETARRQRPVVGLPRALLRVWRTGGGSASTPPESRTMFGRGAGEVSTLRRIVPGVMPDLGPTGRAEDRRFLSDSAVAITARTRPVVLGIVSDATAGALEVDAIVNRVTPNDALLTLERSEPDLVLVEAAALAPSHPWAFAANTAAVERAALLIELIERARRIGRPAVLIRDLRSADHVGLLPLEPSFDLVMDAHHGPDGTAGWSRGVQLARFNPLGAPATRDGRPLFIGGLDPRAPIRERRFIESVLAAAKAHDLETGFDADAPIGWDIVPEALRDTGIGRISWSGLAPIYRRTSLVIANPFTDRDRGWAVDARSLEQLASGTRIVSGPNRAIERLAEAHVTIVGDPDDAARGVAAALDAGAPTSAEMRTLLRALFVGHASAVMLAHIVGRLGLSIDPLSGRSITTVVDLSADSDIGRIVESTTNQIQRPTRTVIRLWDGATWTGEADATMTNAGIDVEVQTADAHRADWSRLESDESTEWLSLWPQGRSVAPTYLLDLLIGGEMSRSDAVGYGPDPGFRFVTRLRHQASIVRRAALDDAGGRRGPFADDMSSESEWAGHGWRFLSVGPEDVA